MKYKMTFDYHTHTVYSHGKGTIEDNVKVAIKRGLEAIAITDHGPGHLTYGIKRSEIRNMRKEIEELKVKYPQIKIYLGVEANIVDKGNGIDIRTDEFDKYDMINAGYHFGIRGAYTVSNFLFRHGIFKSEEKRNGFAKRNTDMVIKAIEKNKINILTHPGDKAPFDMQRIAKACAENNVLMEISTHHPNLTVEEIKVSAKEGAKFVISSDAHRPEDVGKFEEGLKRAIEAEIDLDKIVNIKKA